MGKIGKIAIAATAGFVAGILLAPKSGKETREEIKVKANEAKGRAKEKARQVKSAALEAGETLKDSAAVMEKEARGMAKSTRESADRTVREVAHLNDEAKARGARMAAEARRTTAKVQKDAEGHMK